MDEYFDRLFTGDVALPIWAIAVLWLVIFLANNLITRSGVRSAKTLQQIIHAPVASSAQSGTARALGLQMLFAAAIFGAASALQYDVFTSLYAGGWLVSWSVTLAANLRGFLWVKTIAINGAIDGKLTVSAYANLSDQANTCFAGAALCLFVGILVAQLSLFGGAFILAATGVGCWRQARKVAPRA